MRVLLTGVCGSMGPHLTAQLNALGHSVVGLDLRQPGESLTSSLEDFVQGDISERGTVQGVFANHAIDCVVHIAAFHGIHEGNIPHIEKDEYEFWSLNVDGTFQVFEAAARAGVQKFVYISTQQIDFDKFGRYGHTKVVGETIATMYAHRHDMQVVILRPVLPFPTQPHSEVHPPALAWLSGWRWRWQGAFIPHTDTDVYKDYPSWVRSFYAGFGVHAEDVARCVTCAVTHVGKAGPRATGSEEVVPIVTRKNVRGIWVCQLRKCLRVQVAIDGAPFEYTTEQMDDWDADGPGSTFVSVYGQEAADVCAAYGMDPARKPRTHRPDRPPVRAS